MQFKHENHAPGVREARPCDTRGRSANGQQSRVAMAKIGRIPRRLTRTHATAWSATGASRADVKKGAGAGAPLVTGGNE